MNQLVERIRPWAPTMLGVGLFATLAESLQERDVTSICMILVALLGFFLVVRQHRGLTRGEVRAEVAAGIRALVKEEAQARPPRHIHVPYPPPGSVASEGTLADAPTDPGRKP
jgi:hypothetical protein